MTYINKNRQVQRVLDSLEEFSTIERQILRKMFLYLKIDILSEDNQRIEPFVRKKMKKDLEKQLKMFDTLYKDFRRTKNYNSRQEMKILEECLKASKYYSFLILVWEENELNFITTKLKLKYMKHKKRNVVCYVEPITLIRIGTCAIVGGTALRFLPETSQWCCKRYSKHAMNQKIADAKKQRQSKPGVDSKVGIRATRNFVRLNPKRTPEDKSLFLQADTIHGRADTIHGRIDIG